jgi:hypothetical protein
MRDARGLPSCCRTRILHSPACAFKRFKELLMTATLIRGCLAAAALLTIGLVATQSAEAATARREANGAIRFYDDNGNDRGYAWCLRRSGRSYSGWSDCSYFSYGQCRSAIIGPPGGDCEQNPWSYYVDEPPAPRKKRARR